MSPTTIGGLGGGRGLLTCHLATVSVISCAIVTETTSAHGFRQRPLLRHSTLNAICLISKTIMKNQTDSKTTGNFFCLFLFIKFTFHYKIWFYNISKLDYLNLYFELKWVVALLYYRNLLLVKSKLIYKINLVNCLWSHPQSFWAAPTCLKRSSSSSSMCAGFFIFAHPEGHVFTTSSPHNSCHIYCWLTLSCDYF